MKILVRAPNWIGDSVLAIPAIRSLHENFPEDQMYIAARGWVKDLFSSFDFIKGVIPLPDNVNLKNLRQSANSLKEEGFQVGLLLTNSFSSALLFFMAGIPQRWGYAADGRHILLTKGVRPKKHQFSYSHHVYYYLDLISKLGYKTSPPELAIPLSQTQKQEAVSFLTSLGIDFSRPLVILNPGAYYGSAKRWPISRFAWLAEMLQERNNAEILIIGSTAEAGLAEEIATLMKKRPHILAGKTSLPLLAGIIHKANLFITNDTGPMHIANALKTPLVSLFGPTNPHVTGPFQEPSAVIKKDVPCWPCLYRECPFDHRCMTSIESEEVYLACQKFL